MEEEEEEEEEGGGSENATPPPQTKEEGVGEFTVFRKRIIFWGPLRRVVYIFLVEMKAQHHWRIPPPLPLW